MGRMDPIGLMGDRTQHKPAAAVLSFCRLPSLFEIPGKKTPACSPASTLSVSPRHKPAILAHPAKPLRGQPSPINVRQTWRLALGRSQKREYVRKFCAALKKLEFETR
jgi:hypothetical protein